MRARTLLILTLVGVLSLAGVAGAQTVTPNEDTYERSQVLGEVGEVADAPSQSAPRESAPESDTAPVVEESASPAPVTAPQEAAEGELPFTGLEVGGIAAGGLLLLGCGILLRRRTITGGLA